MDPDLPSVLRSAIEVAYDVDVGYSNPADPGEPQAKSDFRTSNVVWLDKLSDELT